MNEYEDESSFSADTSLVLDPVMTSTPAKGSADEQPKALDKKEEIRTDEFHGTSKQEC